MRGWRDPRDFADTMWLGYVQRDAFDAALRRAGLADREVINVTLTPECSSPKSWLAGSVQWVRLDALTRQWWVETWRPRTESEPCEEKGRVLASAGLGAAHVPPHTRYQHEPRCRRTLH